MDTSHTDPSLTNFKDDFLSMAAHELKTPLTSLRVYNEIIQSLLKKNCPDSALRYTYKMQAQFDRLNKLIFDLLDVSRIQAGKLDLSQSVFYLDSLVKDVVESLQPAFTSHLIYTRGETDSPVIADADRIAQVITNLIINAIKYSPKSDHIIVSLNTTNKGSSIHVQDFGVGIDKVHQSRIFERYYKVDSVSGKYAGLGLGLYVCSQIVTRQGGQIWVESTPGKGSIFSFSLPVHCPIYEPKNYSG